MSKESKPPGRPLKDPEGHKCRLTTLVSASMLNKIKDRRGGTPVSAYLREMIQTVFDWQDAE